MPFQAQDATLQRDSLLHLVGKMQLAPALVGPIRDRSHLVRAAFPRTPAGYALELAGTADDVAMPTILVAGVNSVVSQLIAY